MSCKLILILLSFQALPLLAQLNALDEMAESSINAEIESADLHALIDHIQLKKAHLNTANYSDLDALPLLKSAQILALLKHRNDYGPFLSVYELQQVDGFDSSDIQNLLPFISLELPILQDLKMVFKEHNSSLQYQCQMKLEQSEAYDLPSTSEQAFAGSRVKQVWRLKTDFSKALRFQINGKKDAGETIQFSSTGFNVYYHQQRKLRELVIGNYQLQLAQGLSYGNGMSLGKSANVMGIMKSGLGIRPSASVNNNELLKGMALHLAPFSYWHVLVAISSKKLDASFSTDSLQQSVTGAIITSGYYRTIKEVNTRKTVQRNELILRNQWHWRQLLCGLTLSSHRNSSLKAATKIGKYFSPQMEQAGLDIQYPYKNIIVFHESVYQLQKRQIARVQGILLSIDKHSDISLVHRNYSDSFDPTYSNALSVGNGRNEKGWLLGYQLKLTKRILLNTYLDLYQNSRYNGDANAAIAGKDLLIQSVYSERNTGNITLRYRLQHLSEPDRSYSAYYPLNTKIRENLRLDARLSLSKTLEMHHRIELVRIRNNTSTKMGYLIYHNISQQLNRKLKYQMRLTLFNTDDFESRIYAFENDLSSVFSIKAWQNRGMACYCIVQYHVNKILQIKTKFATVRYSDYQTSGSGADIVKGYQFNEVKFEMTIKI
jgi:hypothetical protein